MTGVDDLALSENSVEEEIGDPGYDIPYRTCPSEPATVRLVMIKESPHLNMFHGHVPIQVTLESGATGNLISSHAAKHIMTHIQPTSRGAHQADGNSPLEVVRETHLTLTLDDKVFHFEGLVMNNLDGDILGGMPFMAHNDIGARSAWRKLCSVMDPQSHIPLIIQQVRLQFSESLYCEPPLIPQQSGQANISASIFPLINALTVTSHIYWSLAMTQSQAMTG